MRKYLFVLFISFITFSGVIAQKEVYFSNQLPDSIKVESMHGFELSSGFNPLALFRPSTYVDKSFSVPLGFSFFKEKRIAKTWTLITRIGLTQNFMNQAHYIYVADSTQLRDSMYHFNSQKLDHYKFEYQLSLGINVEPRWYFSFKNRTQRGTTKLNSGWFLSLPVSVSTILINTYKPEVPPGMNYDFKSYCSFGLSGVLGFRQAISKQWFLEGDLTVLSIGSGLFTLNEKLYMAPLSPGFVPGISLKAAYTFK